MSVVMMCGPSGSGKSTFARTLERDGAVRLSFDVALHERGLTPLTTPPDVMAEVDADLRTRLADLVAGGRDVVLDLTFSTRAMRAEWRALIRTTGVEPVTVYLEVPRPELERRLARRGGAGADDVALTPEQIREHLDTFEPPTADEGPLRIVRQEEPTH
ncbi:AAA family ATPase [Litorihabitans aurantiacus]|uniref:ATP-binding protein n=1 Tax=Litorihabitans aurantiacus TaxID=1930061 RepID=A0AA38CUS2_9MICO|nr:ATP-binding protein [Litorihabitans aurantiacus]GMA30082.1 hypothetical protein GCM10025875_00740 [Litorihabitans aurantiacus]GMA33581.1 hypothetical protein GCM10025875_35730 [Litorihabitans aurantiacus]